MIKRLIFLPLFALLLGPLLAVDTSDATLIGTITVTNNTGEDKLNGVAWFELSTKDLIDRNVANSKALDVEIKDPAGNAVPFQLGLDRFPVLGCTFSEAAASTDETTDCNDAGVDDVSFLGTDSTLAVGDSFTVGANIQFNRIWFEVYDHGRMDDAQYEVIWEYCSNIWCSDPTDLTDWTPLTDVVDTSNGFRNQGLHTVTYDWPNKDDNPNFNSSGFEGGPLWSGYNVRARVTDAGDGTFTTVPTGSQVWVERALGLLFIDAIGNGESRSFDIFVGQSTDRAQHTWFPLNSLNVADDAAIEPGSDFAIEFEAFFEMSDASSSNDDCFVFKDTCAGSDLKVYQDSAKEISFSAGGSKRVTATNVSTGLHKVRIENDAGGSEIFIDDVSQDTGTQATVPDNADNWQFFDGRLNGSGTNAGPTVYFNYVKVEIPNGTEVMRFQPDSFVGSTLPNEANPGSHEPDLDAQIHPIVSAQATLLSLQQRFYGEFTAPFTTTVTLAASPSESATVDVVSDVSGSAEGSGFAGLPAPSSNLPGYNMIAGIANQDYDSVTAGTQELPISFVWLLVLMVILVAVAMWLMIWTKSLLIMLVAVGAVSMLFVSVDVISPWFMMWLAIPGALWLLVKGGLQL